MILSSSSVTVTSPGLPLFFLNISTPAGMTLPSSSG